MGDECWCGHNCGHPWAHEGNPPREKPKPDARPPHPDTMIGRK